MKHIRGLCVGLLSLTAVFATYAESSYDIAEIYEVHKTPSGTKAVNRSDDVVEIKYILSPTQVETGKYSAEVQKIGDNLYRIKDTDICVETRFCYEWASFAEDVILIIDSNYGYTKGKIIFD